MGRIIISNDDQMFNSLRESQKIVGMKENVVIEKPTNVAAFHKYRVENKNFFKNENGAFIATSGTIIYKGLFEENALPILLKDLLELPIKEIRKELMGNFMIIYSNGNDLCVFVDETGTYSTYYYSSDSKYIITNTFYHVQKCVKQSVRAYEYLEEILFPGIFGNLSPFENVFRLMGDELIRIKDNSFVIEKIECNKYEIQSEIFEDNVEQIAEAFRKYCSLRKAIPHECVLFLTGGIDSRLVLSSFLASGQKPSIGNWQGCPVDMNNKFEDRNISVKIASLLDLSLNSFDVAHNVIEDITNLNDELYERYGEYAAIYGNNNKWFEIFEKGKFVHWELGHLGEAYRDVLENIHHDNYTLDEYYDEYLRKHCSETDFIADGNYSLHGMHEYVKGKIRKFCDYSDINVCNLSKNDCQAIFNYMQLHSEMIKANLYNMIGYYTNLYSQKEIFDYSIKINYEYKEGKRIVLSMIEYLAPQLNTIPYFTRCEYMNYNASTKTLGEIGDKLFKTKLRSLISRCKIGNTILDIRAERHRQKSFDENKVMIETYLKEIGKSGIINLLKIRFDKNSTMYIPGYAFINASNYYMDKLTRHN